MHILNMNILKIRFKEDQVVEQLSTALTPITKIPKITNNICIKPTAKEVKSKIEEFLIRLEPYSTIRRTRTGISNSRLAANILSVLRR